MLTVADGTSSTLVKVPSHARSHFGDDSANLTSARANRMADATTDFSPEEVRRKLRLLDLETSLLWKQQHLDAVKYITAALTAVAGLLAVADRLLPELNQVSASLLSVFLGLGVTAYSWYTTYRAQKETEQVIEKLLQDISHLDAGLLDDELKTLIAQVKKTGGL